MSVEHEALFQSEVKPSGIPCVTGEIYILESETKELERVFLASCSRTKRKGEEI